jgi:V-type H+-transporting ATPase subunit e
MGASWVPVIIFTTIWAIVGGILPFIAPRGPQKGVQIVVLVLTASCCWLFWLCCYMSQMNPLIGPVLSQSSLFAIKKYWSGWEMPSEDSGHAIDLGGHDGIPSVGGD